MLGKIIFWGMALIGVFALSGCATVKKSDQLSNQGLRNQISVLEAQLAEKDNQIYGLQEELARKDKVVEKTVDASETKRIDVKMIQTALRNAGYYQWGIDGKMGRNTRAAVKEFQRANNLRVDGRVGKKTWAVLKVYLNKKVK